MVGFQIIGGGGLLRNLVMEVMPNLKYGGWGATEKLQALLTPPHTFFKSGTAL